MKYSLGKYKNKVILFRSVIQRCCYAGIKTQESGKKSSIEKKIEFLSQTLIFLSLYLCIWLSETLDISNYESF